MRANYHTHSQFCDGRSSAAEMAEAAFAAGYRVLGFSSHAPLPFPSSWNLPAERLPDYTAELRRLRGLWAPRGLEILLGLEIDWIENLSGPAAPLFHGLGLDYSLGAVHFVRPGPGPAFTVDEPAEDFARHFREECGGEGPRLYRAYYRALSGLIEEGGFDILAHLDLVTKNNPGGSRFDEDSPDYLAAAFEAIEGLRGKDIVVEINVGGMARGKTTRPYPALPLARRLREIGQRITFSADAHEAGHLGLHLEAARELARAAGYRSLAVLSGGEWRETGLESS